ncbi:MAG: SRPBCC family protein [Ignavibacteria bacterium]|nr:SRPBCC family protein [Ignavibacteria bacterium]
MKTYTLHRTQFLPYPLDEVFPFFESPENLGSITPRWLKFRFITPLPIDMREGAVIEYTISWLGIPIRWKTLISSYNPPHSFSDTQLEGPYARWEHTHSFREVDGGTEMTDTVHYALPFGVLGRFAHACAIRRQVEAIFEHRATVLSDLIANRRRKADQAST